MPNMPYRHEKGCFFSLTLLLLYQVALLVLVSNTSDLNCNDSTASSSVWSGVELANMTFQLSGVSHFNEDDVLRY